MSQAQFSSQISELNKRFGIPGIAQVEPGRGSLPRMVITSDLATAEIYLHGAHITEFQPRGAAPVLFMSRSSQFDAGKPIRGGVPIVFPWFGARAGHPESPAHGMARLRAWELQACDKRADGSVRVDLALSSDDSTLKAWPSSFEIRMIVTVGVALDMTMEVRNTGQAEMAFEQALHTYLSVGDVQKISIEGLGGTLFLDKVDAMQRKTQGPEPIVITGETDRVYMNTPSACIVRDPSISRSIVVEKEDSNSTVVWNPWIAKARAMPDFGETEWPHMVCIETANVLDNSIKLAAGHTHRMRARISLGS